jgi:hypothetical protein
MFGVRCLWWSNLGTERDPNMKSLVVLVFSVLYAFSAAAGDPPSIGGSAAINANVAGAIINGGAAEGGAKVTLKQSVASVLHGNIGGALQVNVDLKGAVINAGAAEGGAEVDACQSVGSIGSDC